MSTNSSTAQSAPATSASAWGLRYSGLVMGPGGKNYVKEFTGMWRLKPDADLDALTKTLAPGGWLNPPGGTFSVQTTKLGLIRTARWFVARTQDFDGYTLFFISQFDGTLEKYFDDFTLNGAENLPVGLGALRRMPGRSGRDRARHRGVHRPRPDQDAGLLRRRTEHQHRPDLQGG